MRGQLKHTNVEAAIEDLESRTLAGIPGELARLVYLASTRDYNTGQYYHDGLAFHFSEEIAGTALAACHRETFGKLLLSSLEDLVQQLDAYVGFDGGSQVGVLEAWKKLEPYRVTIPLDCDPLSAQLFFSNVKTALAILQARRRSDPGN